MTDDIPTDIPTTELPTELDLDIDVATAPELEESELGAALEAVLLVVDTPVTVDQLAVATDQPAYRVAAKLAVMAEELTARESGIELREAAGGWRLYTRARYAPYVERLPARRRQVQADPRGAGDAGGGGVPTAGGRGRG